MCHFDQRQDKEHSPILVLHVVVPVIHAAKIGEIVKSSTGGARGKDLQPNCSAIEASLILPGCIGL